MRSVISRLAGRRSRPDSFALLTAGFGVLGMLLILAREVTYGVDLSWDSVNYIHVARGLLSGDGFDQIYTTAPYTLWPPLYPVLLAVVGVFIFDPRDVAGPLNAAVFGAMVFTVGMYLRQRVESRFLTVWGCLAVMLSWPLVNMATQAMSESVFILFVTVALIFMDKFMERGDKRSLLMWVAVFSALALLTRYLGIALVGMVLVILLFQRGVAVRERFRNVFVYVLISVFPICVWLVRNYVISGGATGPRTGEFFSPFRYSLSEIGSWMWAVFSEWLPLSDSWVVGGVSVVTGAALIVYATIAILGTNGPKWLGRRSFYLFCGFAVAYILALVVSIILGSTAYVFQSRYLVPVYVPLVLVLVFVLDLLFRDANYRNLLGSVDSVPVVRSMVSRWRGRRSKSVLVLVLMVILSAWVGYELVLNVRDVARANGEIGIGNHGNARWADSEILRYFRENLIDEIVISNASLAFQKYIDVSSRYMHLRPDLDNLIERVESLDGAYLVWFHDRDISSTYDYGLPQLRVLPGLKILADLDDGAIFRVNPSYAGVAEDYRSLHASLVSDGTLVIRSEFDVYLDDGELHYVKNPCNADDIKGLFFLHLNPADVSDLPEERKGYGFNNLDFFFGRHGVAFDGKCFTTVRLPMYDIARITTGQFVRDEGDLWREAYSMATPDALSVFQGLSDDGVEPVVRSVFDVYIDGGRLVYAKSSCTDDDRESRFFLHVRPANVSDLPEGHRQRGLENLDFNLWERGGELDGDCFAVVELPEYEISSISTGQFTSDGRVWSEDLEVGGE